MDYTYWAREAAKQANFVVKNVLNRKASNQPLRGRRGSNTREQDAALLASVRLNKPSPTQADILAIAAYATLLGIGNCGELAAVAYKYLFDQGVRPLDYVNLTQPSDHSFVILGRPAEKNPSECGDNVIVCDPWNVWYPVYPISQIPTYMANWIKPGAGYFGCARVDESA